MLNFTTSFQNLPEKFNPLTSLKTNFKIPHKNNEKFTQEW